MTNSAPDAMAILKHTDDDGWAKHDSQCKVCGLTTGKWIAALAVGYRALEAELAETEKGLEVQALISYNAVARAEKAEAERDALACDHEPCDHEEQVERLKARVVELEDMDCEGQTNVKCFACGEPVCKSCTSMISWRGFGIKRVCVSCIREDAVRAYDSLEAGEKEEC